MAAEPPGLLTRNLPLLEDALRAHLEGAPPGLGAISRYVMGWEDEWGAPLTAGGKRIRPALCLAAAEALGAEPEVALPGAIAIELIHNFSLVHDEVQDHDATRHNRPTAWALLGEGQAINAGDYLITRAFEALTAAPALQPETAVQCLAALNRAMGRMITGQWSDIAFESRQDVTTAEYIDMVRGKTGALLGAPLEIGALLAGAPADVAAAFGHWGETVGLAFQVQDDYLGIWGDPNLTGKSNTGDLIRKKKTLPVIHGFEHGAGEALRAVYLSDGEPGEGVLQAAVQALESAGSDSFCSAEAARLAAEGDRLLSELPLSAAAREEFAQVARYLVQRDR